MKVAKNNGIETIITVTNKDNERQVEQMVGKAMCAYANYMQVTAEHVSLVEQYGAVTVEKEARHLSEYEATVRCIALFVDQPTWYICKYVMDRCANEFGLR